MEHTICHNGEIIRFVVCELDVTFLYLVLKMKIKTIRKRSGIGDRDIYVGSDAGIPG